ncbi:hypothetical protein PPYR_06077 [Photinus pyralis]|uniref:Major facilitator superfamily (MFS) profile domain-containing protein n=1 Tax=Photinus pyralis TaxID=7054 RepID=A0A5N4ASM3_PHOPY|nr:organic cation/carnitine transporter 7-like [Photinus pyralis]KAB0800337.1 hypothetical protein PPYR_06077 [Photinus pyralis]
MAVAVPLSFAAKCDQTISRTGFGLYNYFALGMSCACAFSQSTALSSLPFAIPLTICDDYALAPPYTVQGVDFSLYLGMAFGGSVLSSISDIVGRKSLIPITLIIIFGSTLACGFAHHFQTIFVCVFILGCGLQANANTVKIHLAEILPNKRRGTLLTFQDLFWSVGYVAGTLVAWLLTPAIVDHQKDAIRWATWRMIFGLSGMCSIIVSCASALLFPSPRYSILGRQFSEAADTLTRIYAINNSKHWETFSIGLDDLRGCIDEFDLHKHPEPISYSNRIAVSLRKIAIIISELFHQRFLKVTLLLIASKFVVIFDLLTVNVWLTQTVTNNSTDCTFVMTSLHGDNYGCKDAPDSHYGNLFALSVNVFIGQLILMALVERVGRRVVLVCGCATCGILSYIPTFIHNTYTARFVTSSSFLVGYSITDSALNIIIIESYPTAFRGTAYGCVQFFARFVGGILKMFLILPCEYSFILMGSLMLAGAVICYFLPEYRGKPMEE